MAQQAKDEEHRIQIENSIKHTKGGASPQNDDALSFLCLYDLAYSKRINLFAKLGKSKR